MTKAIRIHENGGPEVMRWEDVDVGAPGPGQVRIKHSAVGLNFLDTYQRSGLYPLPLPLTLGMEGAGVVEELGAEVSDLAVGDRVAYPAPIGSYSEARLAPADRMVKLPDGIGDQQAAAMMLQGLTVQYLIRQTHRVEAGETVLVHAAAGGIGLIACQWLKHLGATVIGTVGSAEKAELAKAHGCTHTINYGEEDFVEKVKEITGGAGVPVVYDGVGKDTFEGSLQCLSPLGLMVTFGNASGKPDPVDPQVLAGKGSLFLTRPTLFTHIASRETCQQRADELSAMVTSGKVKIRINQTYQLADVAQAHRDLEARKTTGTTILLP